MNKQEFVFDNGVTVGIDEKVNLIGAIQPNKFGDFWYFDLFIDGREKLSIFSHAHKRGEGKRSLQFQRAAFIAWLNVRKDSDV